jgi:hypothetical protein
VVRGAEGFGPVDGFGEHVGPVRGDVGGVVGVAERAGERGDQAAGRRAQDRRIPMQQNDVRIRILGD